MTIGINSEMNGIDQELRQARRRRVFKAGQVAFNGLQSSHACIVRNVGENGACVDLMGLQEKLPTRLTLFVEMDGTKVECEVAWMRGTKVGLTFLGPVRLTSVVRRQVVDCCTGRPG